MKYPTLKEIELANRTQLARWHRFLPSASNESELRIRNRLYDRFMGMGGFTPEISKQIGWEK